MIDRFAIEPGLPLVSGPQYPGRTPSGSVFHGVIADSEPDGWGANVILRDHAKRTTLAKAAGKEPPPIVGALEFRPELDQFADAFEHDQRTAAQLESVR